MYIIEQGKAYQVNGDVAYQVKFDSNGSLSVDKESEIEVAGKPKYTYDEMYRKLNVAYMIEQYSIKKQDEAKYNNLTSQIEELKAKVEELTKENKELKASAKKSK